MSSDRARFSYNKKRQYRSVVMQQGRVTIESDWNEAQDIVNEEMREQILDVVGPFGASDDGYRIIVTNSVPNPPFDFSVKAGTMYVGGMRVDLPVNINYFNQREREWRDYAGDVFWKEYEAGEKPAREYIYLYLREQEVTAVEDSALHEVALGGPDTAARTRLIQRIVRLNLPTVPPPTECSEALELAINQWKNQGLVFDSQTMHLRSPATLSVGFVEQSITQPNLCEPQVQGGYLGADNQLIRVKVAAADKLVWGFDNASFLYRFEQKPGSNNTLTLDQPFPVDAQHEPHVGQVIEILRPAVKLSSDESEYIASADGILITLDKDNYYTSADKELTLHDNLQDGYLNAPYLFVRLWQEVKPFTSEQAVSLGETGLQVTLRRDQNVPNFHVGDYWVFAVRPGVVPRSEQIYPARYRPQSGNSFGPPQLPDGPRLWICPLALIAWNDSGILKVIRDCRQVFSPLTKPCCTHHNHIGTWLVLGPIFDPKHQVEGHSADPNHDRQHPRIEDIINITDQINPNRITNPSSLNNAPHQGDIIAYGGEGKIFSVRNYMWRVMTFSDIDWMNIHDIEDNIHKHLSADVSEDPYDVHNYLNFVGKSHALAFFLVYITNNNPQPTETRLYVRSDDAIRVWLNGEEIEKLKYIRERDISDYKEYSADIMLNVGVNILLAAVAQAHVEWGFSARIEHDENLVFSPNNPDRLYEEIHPCYDRYRFDSDREETIINYITIAGDCGGGEHRNGWNFNDIDRVLFCEGGSVWKGRVKMHDTLFKFFANGIFSKDWGKGGQNGENFTPGDFDPPIVYGEYDVIFDIAKTISPRDNSSPNPVFMLVKPFKWLK